jgi:methionine-rich copper-binding protein CopC
MRRLLVILLCVVGFAGAAEAHARLESAVPAVGGTVSTPPAQVAITFSEAVEPAFSVIEVTDSAGKRVDSGKPHTSPDSGRVLIVDLQPLTPGTYSVTWRATSVDTHKTQGNFTFNVGP